MEDNFNPYERFCQKLGKKNCRLTVYKGDEHIVLGPIDLNPALAGGTFVSGLTVRAAR